MFPDFAKVEIGSLLSVDLLGAWDEVGTTSVSVHDNEDAIKSFAIRALHDEVVRDEGPGDVGSRERGKRTVGFLTRYLGSLAQVAGVNVSVDELRLG